MSFIEPTPYYLFLDECGDQNLSNFDPSFPVFTLCGVIMSQAQLDWISNEINALKKEYWGDKKIILHSRDIRKCQNGFEILFDLEVKQSFYNRVNSILKEKMYVIVCCSILKEPYIRQYGRLNDVYGLSLSYIMERTVFYLDSLMKENIHPKYEQTTITCACGNVIETGSTRKDIRVEICSKCHPFYTGKQKLVDTGGRVDRFKKRFNITK